MGDIVQSKTNLRSAMRSARRNIESTDRARFHQAMADELVALAESRCASYVGVYAAKGSEADPAAFVALWRARGGRFAWPRVEGDELRLHLSETPESLSPGYRGIAEPNAQTPTSSLESLDMLVVPGLAFDRQGGRLGQGGGFYDRLLADGPRPYVVGLAYSCQLVDLVPMEGSDRSVDCVLTENGIESS